MSAAAPATWNELLIARAMMAEHTIVLAQCVAAGMPAPAVWIASAAGILRHIDMRLAALATAAMGDANAVF